MEWHKGSDFDRKSSVGVLSTVEMVFGQVSQFNLSIRFLYRDARNVRNDIDMYLTELLFIGERKALPFGRSAPYLFSSSFLVAEAHSPSCSHPSQVAQV